MFSPTLPFHIPPPLPWLALNLEMQVLTPVEFRIPAGFKWYVLPRMGLGAFALNQFILRNLRRWWRSSSTVIIIAGNCCLEQAVPVSQELMLLFGQLVNGQDLHCSLDADWAFLCCKIMLIVWGFATHHAAFGTILTFVKFWILSKYFVPFTKVVKSYFISLIFPHVISFSFQQLSALALFLFVPDTVIYTQKMN